MAYVEDRVVHDADSHLMELDDCLDPWFDAASRRAFHDLPAYQRKRVDAEWKRKVQARHADQAFRAEADGAILLRKNHEAMGSFRREDRPRALDLLGFASQLVFTTFCLGNFGLDESGPTYLAHAAARAHNRMMTDFCAVTAAFWRRPTCPSTTSPLRPRLPATRSNLAPRLS